MENIRSIIFLFFTNIKFKTTRKNILLYIKIYNIIHVYTAKYIIFYYISYVLYTTKLLHTQNKKLNAFTFLTTYLKCKKYYIILIYNIYLITKNIIECFTWAHSFFSFYWIWFIITTNINWCSLALD